MKITINGKVYIFPDVIENLDGTHSIDKSHLLNEYCNEKIKKTNPVMWYTSQGAKDKTAHKKACKEFYAFYLKHVKCDYFATLIYPEKSKSVFGIAIYDKLDMAVQEIISNGLEITLNSNGKWALRLRLNNKQLTKLANMGAVLQEFTPTEFNNECQKVLATYKDTEFTSLGQIFETWYFMRVNPDKIGSAFIDNTPFWESPDLHDSILDLGVQCKAQKATICTIDSLIELSDSLNK